MYPGQLSSTGTGHRVLRGLVFPTALVLDIKQETKEHFCGIMWERDGKKQKSVGIALSTRCQRGNWPIPSLAQRSARGGIDRKGGGTRPRIFAARIGSLKES